MDTASKNRYLHFYPRSPCGERLYCHCWHLLLQKISIHALLAESDPTTTHISTLMLYFYPRSPCGERLFSCQNGRQQSNISIHALLAESDRFLPTLPMYLVLFLSTLSLRRATSRAKAIPAKVGDFYPRSPCGERLHFATLKFVNPYISIHALLAESDITDIDFRIIAKISIHALLAESDLSFIIYSITDNCISIHALLAESDQQDKHHPHHERGFLSTLSLRRATRYRRTS